MPIILGSTLKRPAAVPAAVGTVRAEDRTLWSRNFCLAHFIHQARDKLWLARVFLVEGVDRRRLSIA